MSDLLHITYKFDVDVFATVCNRISYRDTTISHRREKEISWRLDYSVINYNHDLPFC